ncbi:MAG: ABC transporter substrate-binding protein, partial [Oscillospiraceae bacterium]
MKIKKILAGILVLAIAAATVGCGSAPSNDNSGNTAKQPTKTAAEMKIGVIQGSEHVALDAACAGFVETLVANGFTEDNIDVQNAQGEQSNCGTIATKFVNDGVDLILTIGTPASQAAAQATKDIPILVTAVTDPASAGLVKSNEKPECNVSGTSDMNPIKEQIDLLMKFVPEAKNVGIMYCSSEVNSEIQADLAKADLEGRGIAVKYYTAADSSEIQAVMQSAVDKVDAIYIPTDNLFAGAMDTV